MPWALTLPATRSVSCRDRLDSLRHLCASRLIRHGESVKVVQARPGHPSAAETSTRTRISSGPTARTGRAPRSKSSVLVCHLRVTPRRPVLKPMVKRVVMASRPVGGVLSAGPGMPVTGGVAIHLRGLPGDIGRATRPHIWPCSGWGLPSRLGHPGRWCALAAPFHPCLCTACRAIGGLFSVALSCGSPRLAVSQHPALWSPDLPQPTAVLKHRSGRGHPADSPSPSPFSHVLATRPPQALTGPKNPSYST